MVCDSLIHSIESYLYGGVSLFIEIAPPPNIMFRHNYCETDVDGTLFIVTSVR